MHVAGSTISPILTTHTPADPAAFEKEEVTRQELRQKVLTAFKERSLPEPFELPVLNEEQLEAANEGAQYLYSRGSVPEHIKLMNGARHFCFTTNRIPGVIFKASFNRNEPECQEYIKRADKTREFCKQNNLFLIHIPTCTSLQLVVPALGKEKRWVIMEEEADLLGNGLTQIDVYRFIVRDPPLEAYSKELLRQEIQVDCFLGFGDTREENVSITTCGRATFFDLDEGKHLCGLTLTGGDGGGLLGYLPLGWFDEYACFAQEYLSEYADPYIAEVFQEALPEARKKAEQKERLYLHRQAFFADRQIVTSSQTLVEPSVEGDLKFAVSSLICSINVELKERCKLELTVGRRIVQREQYLYRKPERKEAVQLLQEWGYICDYSITDYGHTLTIDC